MNLKLLRQFCLRALAAYASATFALNAAECVRRVLFVIAWFPL
jgi:hypothetical protein